ncbi:hypothetical protein ACJMK2_016522 [Sinanodonta woodiana]|uniref:Uncharacterized protein n=1 Tax=Sinanodonta woodiana TaxID=1069815 RepID=A0ABD3UTV8_SINWO
MSPSTHVINLADWKKRIKEKWDQERKQVIFQGAGDIIYPTRLTTMPTTPQITTTAALNTTHGTDFTTTANNSYATEKVGSDKSDGSSTADAENLVKFIGITIASLLALIIITLIIIRVCRRSVKKKNKRISLRRPLQSEDPDHIYAEIEPLRANDIESPSTSSGAVPLPTKKNKRRLGVSSIRYVSMRLGRLFGTGSRHSATNDAISFSKESESVRAQTLPPSVPDFRNGDRKGKRRAPRQQLPSSSRPLLDGESQISSSSDVLVEMRERENVYNPLTRQTDSGPYDHLKLGKTGSGAHIADEGAPGSPHDYFVLEKEKGANPQNGDKKSNLYFILEKEEEKLDKDLSPKPAELESMEEDDHITKLDTNNSISPKEKSESKTKDHDYFVLETTARSTSSEESAGQSLQEPSPRVSYELAKNVSNSDENQSLSDDNSLSTSLSTLISSPGHKIDSEVHQKNKKQNYVVFEAADNSIHNYNDPSKENSCVEHGLKGGDDFDQKDSGITRTKNTSSDDYMEPVKLKTHSDYLEISPSVPERTTSKQPSFDKTTSKQQSHLIGQLQNNKVT